jgi:membrane associated rhomboid family serine protease
MTTGEYPPPRAYIPARRPIAWVTWFLLVSTIGVFLLQLAALHRYGEDLLGEALAFSPDALAEHRYWTVLTYAWAHAVAMFGDSGLFWLHIVANMVFLFCLGPAVEEMIGHLRFLALYLGGAIFSALCWYAFNWHSPEGIIGASGAIFALIGAAGTMSPRARVTVYLFYVLPLRMTLGVMAAAVCGIELLQILFGWFPEIAHSAHLGGAAFGVGYVMAIRKRFGSHR